MGVRTTERRLELTKARTKRRHAKRAAAVADRVAYYRVRLEAAKKQIVRRDKLADGLRKELETLRAAAVPTTATDESTPAQA